MTTMMTVTTVKIDPEQLVAGGGAILAPPRTSGDSVRNLAALVLMSSLVVSCVSFAPRSQPVSQDALVIDGTQARKWGKNRCAAGALSEVLNFWGNSVTEDQLSTRLQTARNGGVITVDLLITARTMGFDAQLTRGDIGTVQGMLRSGKPVILMLRVMDAPGSADDLFHYVVLSGVDPDGLVQLHYGDGRKRWVSLRPLSEAWAAAGYATLLVGPRKPRQATMDDLRRAVVLEEAGNVRQAVRLYDFFLTSHPESVVGWTNLGNARAKIGEPELAEVAYRNALFLEPLDRDALNNLAWFLFERKRLEEAEAFARLSSGLDLPDRYLALDTLSKILAARGNCAEADQAFQQALKLVRGAGLKLDSLAAVQCGG